MNFPVWSHLLCILSTREIFISLGSNAILDWVILHCQGLSFRLSSVAVFSLVKHVGSCLSSRCDAESGMHFCTALRIRVCSLSPFVSSCSYFHQCPQDTVVMHYSLQINTCHWDKVRRGPGQLAVVTPFFSCNSIKTPIIPLMQMIFSLQIQYSPLEGVSRGEVLAMTMGPSHSLCCRRAIGKFLSHGETNLPIFPASSGGVPGGRASRRLQKLYVWYTPLWLTLTETWGCCWLINCLVALQLVNKCLGLAFCLQIYMLPLTSGWLFALRN